MNHPTMGTCLSPQSAAMLARAMEREWIDASDARLVELLCGRVQGLRDEKAADTDALAATVTALCRACTEGSLCLPCDEAQLGGALRDLLPAAGTPGMDPAPGALAARFLADANAGRLDAVLGDPETCRPLVRAGGDLYFHRHWFAQKEIGNALRARMETAQDAADPAARGSHLADTARIPRIAEALHETLVKNPLLPHGPEAPPLALATRQKWALAAALHARVFVLSGGPGTGKTTWTTSWLRALLRLPGTDPERVRLCAPTGRAAQRLQESIRAGMEGLPEGARAHFDDTARAMPVSTLHTLLGYQPRTGRFARNAEDPLDADWVLVDEASMVDVFLLAALMRALHRDTRLVLVGDPDQLPPVDAGSVLGELLPANREPCLPPSTRAAVAEIFPKEAGMLPPAAAGVSSMQLDVSHRAREVLLPLSAAVLAGNADGVLAALGGPLDPFSPFAAGRASPIPAASTLFAPDAPLGWITADAGALPAALPSVLHAWADAAFTRHRKDGKTYPEWLRAFRIAAREEEPRIAAVLWKIAAAARVLAPLRKGPLSTTGANRILRARLEPQWSERGDAAGLGFHGATILITRNDRATGLSNGEIGLWLEAAGGATVFFSRPELPDGWLRIPAGLLPAHEPGFASTVHKSQGSECDEVFLILPAAGNRLLARETLYTAITRARSAVRVIGTEDALREAVDNQLQRRGGLRSLLTPGAHPEEK